jgi:hypothetical protein
MVKRSRTPKNNKQRLFVVLAIIAFSSVGAMIIRFSDAASFVAIIEPENGIKTNVQDCSSPQASQGKCIQFNSNTNNGGTVYTQACSKQLVHSVSGTVNSAGANLGEISGVVASRKQNGVYWVHNDSGDSARIVAINPAGAVLGVFSLTGSGVSAYDYEDIGIGPGPVVGKDYLYIADIGDNNAVRSSIKIYRVAEPSANIGGKSQAVAAEWVTLKYPDGAHNAESFFVDPRDGYWYIVQKTTNGESKIYKTSGRNLSAGSTTTLTDSGVRFLKGTAKPYQETTSADMSPDASTIIIRTYQSSYIYDSRNKTVESALSGTPCVGPVVSEGQGEAVGFKPDSRGYVSISEGNNQRVNNIDMR